MKGVFMSFSMKANKGGEGGNREKVPPGNHPAVLVALIDLGSQYHNFGGEEKWNSDVYLVFEFPTKKDGTGKPFLLGESVTLSLNEKATLRKWAQSITGKVIPDGADFDITTLLGRACLVNVLHGEKGYPKPKDVTAYPEGMPEPVATRPPFSSTLEEFKAGKLVPEWVPWMWSRSLKRMASIPDNILASKELSDAPGPQPALAGAPIPF